MSREEARRQRADLGVGLYTLRDDEGRTETEQANPPSRATKIGVEGILRVPELLAAATPTGRGPLAVKLASYAVRHPLRALTAGTAAAHAAGHLDMPEPKEGEKQAGFASRLPGHWRWGERAGQATIDLGLYSGPAIYEAGKGVALDAEDASHGDLSFKRTKNYAKDVGKSIATGVRHPLRPESVPQNLLLGLGGANVLAHAAERGRGAAGAVRAGEGPRRAVTRKGSESGSLLHTRRAGVKGGKGQGDSTLHGPGGIKAKRLEPDAPILRPGHHARTRWLNWRLSHPDAPFNRWAAGRAENVLARERASGERVHVAADRNRINFLRNQSHKLSQPEHTASRLVFIEGRAPEGGWYAFEHAEQVVKRHAATERAYARRARARGDHDNARMHLIEAKAIEDALPVLRKPSTKFRATLRQGAKESRRGEKADLERGHLDVAQAENRKAGLAFLHGRGAPARALAGETRDQFLRRAAKTDRRLAAEAAHAKRKAKRATKLRPGTVAETVEERLAKLDRWYDRLVDRAARELDPLQPEVKRQIVAGRNARTNKARNVRPKVNDEIRAHVEDRIAQVAARSKHPTAQRTARLLAEREQLRDLLNERGMASIEGRSSPSLEGVTTTRKRVDRVERPENIRRHEQRIGKIAAERRRLAEQAAEAEGLSIPGATFFSTAEHFKLPMRSTQARGAQTGAGTSIGPPAKGRHRFGSMRHFTGSGIERTGQVQRPITGIAELQAGRTIAHAQEDLYSELWNAATPKKTTEFQVAIRSARTNPLDLRRLERAQKAADAGDDTPLGDFIRSRYDDLVVPQAESQLVGVGERLPGVRWIDKALVKRLEPTGTAQSGLAKFARAINRPARFFGVYGRPAYIATNKLGNEAMGIFLHGPKGFATGTRGQLKRSLGQEALAIAEGAAGTTRTESYRMADLMRRNYAHTHPAGKALGQAGGAAAWLEDFIVRHVTNATDRSFRLRMFEIRAAQRGYTDAAALRKLLTSKDPAVRADLARVGRRARKDAVDFDSLTPGERHLSEVFYFWPWTSRAFAWTGRSMANRPLSAGVLAAAAPVARDRQPDWLREAPEWLRGSIATKAGLISVSPVWTWATPAQTVVEAKGVGETLLGKRKFGQELSFAGETGTPIFQLAAGRPLQAVFGTSGLFNLAGFGRKGKTFPDNSLKARAKRFLGGSLIPRQPDREYLHDKALSELPFDEKVQERSKALAPDERAAFIQRERRVHERRDWSPERRATASVFDERQHFAVEAKRLGLLDTADGKLPEPLRRAFNLEAARQGAYAKASAGIQSGTRAYQAARFEADLTFLGRFHAMKPEEIGNARANAATADRAGLKTYRDWISRHYYRPGFLDTILEARTALRKAGAKGLD